MSRFGTKPEVSDCHPHCDSDVKGGLPCSVATEAPPSTHKRSLDSVLRFKKKKLQETIDFPKKNSWFPHVFPRKNNPLSRHCRHTLHF